MIKLIPPGSLAQINQKKVHLYKGSLQGQVTFTRQSLLSVTQSISTHIYSNKRPPGDYTPPLRNSLPDLAENPASVRSESFNGTIAHPKLYDVTNKFYNISTSKAT